MLRHAGAFLFFLALAVAFTWPLAARLKTTVSDPGDPLLNAFILDWVAHALTHHPLHLFDAPIFHPAKFPLALSEHMTGLALLVLPFHLAGVGAVALHNIAMLLSFALAGYGAFVLARVVVGDPAASLLCGVLYAFVPYRFDHLSHVQVIASGWIPLTLAALLRFHRTSRRRDGALFAAAFALNGLTNVYWLLFTGVAVAVTIAFLDRTGPPFPRRRLAGAVAAAALVLLPFLIPYKIVSKTYRMSRNSLESSAGSATWADWITASESNRWYGVAGRGRPERNLFPGFIAIALAALAVPWKRPELRLRRRKAAALSVAMGLLGCALLPWNKSDVPFTLAVVLAAYAVEIRPREAALWVAAIWTAVGFAGSFGENSFLHSFLFRVVEPFRATRAPARWAIIAYCGLALLAAIGATRLRRLRWVLLALAILETAPRIAWQSIPAEVRPVYRWLAAHKPAAAIELPIGWDANEFGYVLAAATHRVPVMNGVSGFDPPLHRALSRGNYDDAMLELIRENGAELAIVHPAAAARVQAWAGTGDFLEVARFPDGDVVYRIAPSRR